MDSCCQPSDHKHQHPSALSMAVHCTFHCLMGCGLGEIAGFIIAASLRFPNTEKIIISVVLGFVFGFYLALRPLVKGGMHLKQAVKIVFVAEFISISVMETAEVMIEVHTPGVMNATLAEPVFWVGMGLALLAGFMAAFPVNFLMIKRGVRQHHH